MGSVRRRVIRPATADDLDAFVRLNAVVQKWHADNYPDRFKAEAEPFAMRGFFADRLAEQDCHLLIEQACNGYVLAKFHASRETVYGYHPAALHIDHLAVLPTHQRTGIGRALVSATERLARDLGCEALTLDTWAANTDAREMFGAMGMAPVRHHFAKALNQG